MKQPKAAARLAVCLCAVLALGLACESFAGEAGSNQGGGQNSGQGGGSNPNGGNQLPSPAGGQYPTSSNGGSNGTYPAAAPPPEETSAGGSWHSAAYYREQQQNSANTKGNDFSAVSGNGAPPPDASGSSGDGLSLADKKLNFSAVVTTFVDGRSADGYWKVVDPKTKKILKLKIRSIDHSSMTGGKRDPYMKGRVFMRALGQKSLIPVTFTVDFSGDEWKVVKYALPAAAKKTKHRAPADDAP